MRLYNFKSSADNQQPLGSADSNWLGEIVGEEQHASKLLHNRGRTPWQAQVTFMEDQRAGHQRLWISSADDDGNEVHPMVLEAAHRTWDRARLVVVRFMGEDSEAAEIVEEVAQATSRSMEVNGAVRSIESYLLKSVAREAIRRKKRAGRLVLVEPSNLEILAGSTSQSYEDQLDRDRFIAQLRGAMDSKTLALFEYRRLDYSWKAIALALNYANAHSAELQFQKGLSRALKRIKSYSRPPRENED